MTEETREGLDRRGFLTHVVPACAVTCLALGGSRLFGAEQDAGQAAPGAPKHKFDGEFGTKLTYRQLFRLQYATNFIPLVRVLKKDVGREKTIALLEQMAQEGAGAQAQAAAKRFGGNDMAALTKMFGTPELRSIWTPEVLEQSPTTYRLRVTECLWATTFRQADLAAEGHAAVCTGDFAFIKAFNPGIELTRDKTLMQGDDCCNHCYRVAAAR